MAVKGLTEPVLWELTRLGLGDRTSQCKRCTNKGLYLGGLPAADRAKDEKALACHVLVQQSCLARFLQGKLRIGLGEESVVSALAHAQLLHRGGSEDADGALANRLERAVQAVKQAVSQCPSYDVLIPALLKYPLEVKFCP